jgi:hypothetical protein
VGVRAKDKAGKRHRVPRAHHRGRQRPAGHLAAVQNALARGDPEAQQGRRVDLLRGRQARSAASTKVPTTVAFVPDKGWFWYIPAEQQPRQRGRGGRGQVPHPRRHQGPEGDLRTARCQQNKWIEEHLAGGQPAAASTGYYRPSTPSARSTAPTDGLVLVGDAFGFLDPVFF